MRKIYLLLMATVFVFPAFAQNTTILSSKFTDNWFIGVNGGVSSKTTEIAVFQNLNPLASITVGNYLTPSYGISLSGQVGFDNAPRMYETKQFVKGSLLTLQHLFNLNNIFFGYKNEPNRVEVVALAGLGWTREYATKNYDYLSTKFGLQLNFNLCQSKAWQLNVEPSIVYNLTGYGAVQQQNAGNQPYLHVDNSYLNLLAGITYKFKNSNGTNNFSRAELRNQNELDVLHARINSLRSEIIQKEQQVHKGKRENAELKKELEKCLNKAPQQVTVKETIVEESKALESVVTFRQGKSYVDDSQLPNVERIATYLKNNIGSKVVIKGYASPEGSREVNEKLAIARAESVKTILITRYRVAANRIDAQGNGVGDMFSEPDWNRVSICTIKE